MRALTLGLACSALLLSHPQAPTLKGSIPGVW